MTTQMERNGKPQVKNEEMDDIEGSESNEGVDSHHSIQEIHIAERTAATGGPSKKRICLNPKTDQTEEDPKDAETSEKEESDLEEYEEDTTTDGDRPGPSGMSKGSAEASYLSVLKSIEDYVNSLSDYCSLTCPVCSKKECRSKAHLSRHIVNHMQEVSAQKKLSQIKDLIKNKRNISQKTPPKVRYVYSNDSDEDSMTQAREGDMYICSICGIELESIEQLEAHNQIAHEHPCLFCHTVFSTVKELKEHEASHFKKDKVLPIKGQPSTSRKVLHFNRGSKQVGTNKQEKDDISFVCHKCWQVFKSPNDLAIHDEICIVKEGHSSLLQEVSEVHDAVSNITTDEEASICYACDKNFYNKMALVKHLRTVHCDQV